VVLERSLSRSNTGSFSSASFSDDDGKVLETAGQREKSRERSRSPNLIRSCWTAPDSGMVTTIFTPTRRESSASIISSSDEEIQREYVGFPRNHLEKKSSDISETHTITGGEKAFDETGDGCFMVHTDGVTKVFGPNKQVITYRETRDQYEIRQDNLRKAKIARRKNEIRRQQRGINSKNPFNLYNKETGI